MLTLSNADIRAERRRMEDREDANDEGPTTFGAAEQLALILDRYEGDWGDDAEALAAIRDRIHDITTDVRLLLGEPAKAVFKDGRIVCLVREALEAQMSDDAWMPASTAPEDTVVRTIIRDERGERNDQNLRRRGRLWWTPDGGMYVYYQPTHWRPAPRKGAL